MKCQMRKCQTGVGARRPFCTRHEKMLPYRITKDFWLESTRGDAIRNAIDYLDTAEDYSK